jgi:hypothetical protein
LFSRQTKEFNTERWRLCDTEEKRFLRGAFVSEKWKELGIADKPRTADLFSVNDCHFNSYFWGVNGGMLLAPMQRNSNGKNCSFFLGESALLSIFSRTVGLDLAACSETERAEMAKMEGGSLDRRGLSDKLLRSALRHLP